MTVALAGPALRRTNRWGLAPAVGLCWALVGCAIRPPAESPLPPATGPSVLNPASILREAEASVPAAPDYQRDQLLAEVAGAQADAQDWAAAVASGTKIKNEWNRGLALNTVAIGLVRAGQLDKARRVLAVDHAPSKWRAEGLVFEHVCAQAAEGRTAEALDGLTGLPDVTVRAKGLARVAAIGFDRTSPSLRQAWRESMDAAVAAARAAEPSYGIAARCSLSLACHDTGDDALSRQLLQEAAAAVPRIGEPCPEANQRGALARIAIAQAKTGNLAAAKKTLQQLRERETGMHDPADRDEATRAIIHVALEAEQIDQALELADSIRDFTQYRDEALVETATVLAKMGRGAEAAAAYRKIGSQSRKAQAMLSVAIVQAQKGEREAARRTAAGCSLVRPADLGPEQRFDYENPGSWTTLYDSPDYFTMTSFSIAVHHAADLVRITMQLAVLLGQSPRLDGPSAEFTPGEVFLAAAEAQAAAGRGETALSWARRLPAGEARVMALVGVARGLTGRRADDRDE